MKNLLIVTLCLLVSSTFAQDQGNTGSKKVLIFNSNGDAKSLTSKNGHEILPKKGDWALGVDALPLFEYLGNIANGNTDNDNLSFTYAEKNFPTATIYGKYFIADDLAYRGSVNIFSNVLTDRFRTDDDSSNNPDDAVFDVRKINLFGVTLSAGLEKRKGSSRVQGVYGAEVFTHFTTNNTTKIEYGNGISASNQDPSGTNFGNPSGITAPALGERVIEANIGNRFDLGLRGFIGVEYFFAPKMSVGGEFYMQANYRKDGNTTVTYEAYEGSQNAVVEFSTFSEGGGDFILGINNSFGAINLMFYF